VLLAVVFLSASMFAETFPLIGFACAIQIFM